MNILKKVSLYLRSYNYSKDTILDSILKKYLKLGIKDFKSFSQYSSIVTFNDGTEYYFWNANKWYAWLSAGTFTDINGKNLYQYDGKRLSVSTMILLDEAISKHVSLE